ncbi:MAG TPA: LamG-like jellyroll fold domain-containing protein [Candidatus Acidoferrum sp.]|nr:LamG-like jellyroll fold domain-containing protein [Candidatus Acidoferrum sp.]
MPRFIGIASRECLLWLTGAGLLPGLLQAAPPNLRGSLGIHDPSDIVKCNGRYYVFATGNGIASKSSADKQYWVTGPTVFPIVGNKVVVPSWTTNAVPGFQGNFWAPHVLFMNGQYYLYYAVSTFGSQVSAIGLATNPTLDPANPAYQWTDQGPVIQSSNGSLYNCIDPSIALDASGNLWMSFGSFWNGIYLVKLDTATGLLNATPTLTQLAINTASGDPIEASYLYYRGGYYYLFVNWGTCCAGVNSTYNIRVGRSTSITGPYLDRNGLSMVAGGGTLFLKTTGKYIGPGQTGILDEGGTNCFSYHYYDGNANGTPLLDVEPLFWTPDSWPAFTNDWAAVYRFQFDGRDGGNQYYSLIQNGAYVHNDPLLGSVLVFNGTNQFVNLPDGAANGCTIAAVFKWNGGANGQRVFDFGRLTSSYAYLTPQATSGNLRFAITASGAFGERPLEANGPAPVDQWTAVAVTTDGSQGVLYVNGAPVATNASMTLTLPDIAPTNTWFGRSQSAANPYFNGQIAAVRIYGRSLAAAEIVAPQPVITVPLAGTYYQPGGTIAFAGNATDFADNPLDFSNLTWTVEYRDANSTNVGLGPITGVGSGSFTVPSDPSVTNGSYRILLTAVDTLGRSATNFLEVDPGPANWTASYPFNNGATDANGFFNGTLGNGAATTSDSIRGPVLNLNGAGQYVGLPSGIGSLRTFSGWVKWGGGNAWQRIFDFGINNTSYAMLTAKANNGKLRFEITPNGSGEVRDLDSPNPLPTNVWTHVAIALDGRQAVMFINGQAVAANSSVNLLPADVAGGANYLGRSQFSADPYLGGQLDSVQVSSETLPIEQITAACIGLSRTGSNLTLNWPAWTNGLVLGSTIDLNSAAGWSVVTNPPWVTNGVNFLTLTPTNRQQLFRLQLP